MFKNEQVIFFFSAFSFSLISNNINNVILKFLMFRKYGKLCILLLLEILK